MARQPTRGKGLGRVAVAAVVLSALVAPAAALANPEPNNTIAQAAGPLAGGTDYTGKLETGSDQDWFFFHAAGGRQLTVTATNRTSEDASCEVANVQLQNGAGVFSTVAVQLETSERITYTTAGPEKLFLRVDGLNCDPVGGPPVTYELKVDPADAVTIPAGSKPLPAGSSTACEAARARRDRLERSLRRSRRKRNQARSPAARRRLSRQVRKRSRQLRAARRQAKTRCA